MWRSKCHAIDSSWTIGTTDGVLEIEKIGMGAVKKTIGTIEPIDFLGIRKIGLTEARKIGIERNHTKDEDGIVMKSMNIEEMMMGLELQIVSSVIGFVNRWVW